MPKRKSSARRSAIVSSIYHARNNNDIRILLVGAGGTGSHLLHRLGAINHQLKLMVDKQLAVSVCDFDIVEEHNCGRQLFDRNSHIGLSKAKCLVENVNYIYGTSFMAYPERYSVDLYRKIGPALIIVAVDNVETRLEIARSSNFDSCSIMDIGNGDSFGQVLLDARNLKGNNPRYSYVRGTDIAEYFKPLEKTKNKKVKSTGCSSVDSLIKQNVLINATMAIVAANLITKMLYNPEVFTPAVYVNNETLTVNPVELE